MMKSKLMNISIAAILCSNLFMGYANTYAEDIKAWFGNAENDYTENFENGETVFTKTSGNVYIDGTQNRVINGSYSYTIEYDTNSKTEADVYIDKSEENFSEGCVNISFSERVRKTSANTSVSIASSGAELTSRSHLTDNYIFQVRNNGANFDLYVNNSKVGALSTKSEVESDLSSIMCVNAIIDLDNDRAVITGVLKNGNDIIEEKEYYIDNVTGDISGIHMTSIASYSSLIVDDFKVCSTDDTVPEKPVSTDVPLDNEIFADESFDSLPQNDNTYIVCQTGKITHSQTIGDITYSVGARDTGGDGTTGIKVYANGDDKYIGAKGGRFSNAGRHGYLTLDNAKKFEELSGNALMMRFDIMMKNSTVEISDGAKTAIILKNINGVLNISNGPDFVPIDTVTGDKWCSIEINANQTYGKYSISVLSDNKLLYVSEHSYVESDVNGLSRFDFGKNETVEEIAYINNLKLESGKASPMIQGNTENNMHDTDISLSFKDNADWRNSINAVKVDGKCIQPEQYAVSDGSMTISKDVFDDIGIHNIVISANGYSDVLIEQMICADVVSVKQLSEIVVREGTRLNEVMEILPKQAVITLSNGDEIESDVVWSEESEPEYNMNSGTFSFNGDFYGLPQYVNNPGEYRILQTVRIETPEKTAIESCETLSDIVCEVSNKTPYLSDIVEDRFPKMIMLYLEDGTTYNADVKWECKDVQEDSYASEGEYNYSAQYINLPSYIENVNDINATVKLIIEKKPGVRVQEDEITTEALASAIYDSSFSNDNLVTYNGWQYAVYYTTDKHPAISRRKIDDKNWETIVFTDYTRTMAEDGHYVISMGICAEDGTIHMAWDGWNTTLRYRISDPGIANDPENIEWSAESFSGVLSTLNGLELPKDREENYGFGYPRFIMIPTTGKLQFETRLGYSGNSDNWLFEYDSDGWETVGKIAYGTVGEPVNEYTNTFYIHGIDYDNNGRMHITWTWRERARTGFTDLETCHDLNYVYSDDYGRTFYNSAGELVANTTDNPITQKTPGIAVVDIPRKSGTVNQECQAVDSQGRIHVVIRHMENMDQGGSTYRMHYWRDNDGVWHSNKIVKTNVWNRGKIFFDSTDRAYYIFDTGLIYTATSENNWTDWTLMTDQDQGNVNAEPLVDKYALKTRDALYIFAPNSGEVSRLSVIKYDLNFGKTKNEIPVQFNVSSENLDCNAVNLSDDNYMTRWEAADKDGQWIELDFGTEVKVNTLVIRQAYYRINEYSIEYNNNDNWIECAHGSDLKEWENISFDTVQTDKIRIRILSATDNPSLFDVKAFYDDAIPYTEIKDIVSVERTDSADNSILKVNINTDDEEISNGVLINAGYNEDGELIECKVTNINNQKEFIIEMNPCKTTKTFIFRDMNSIKPLIDMIQK